MELLDGLTVDDASYVAIAELVGTVLFGGDVRPVRAPDPRCQIALVTGAPGVGSIVVERSCCETVVLPIAPAGGSEAGAEADHDQTPGAADGGGPGGEPDSHCLAAPAASAP